jgi:hypothetical protein
MKNFSVILISSLLILALICGLYLNHRWYDPKMRLQKSQKEVKNLINREMIKSGDLIFQTSLSKQSKAIQLATHSKYSHCGIIYRIKDDYFVYEAIQHVSLTPIAKWIARGKDSHFVIKRLINADSILTADRIQKMIRVGETFKGKNYDIYFDWSDDKIYCSELIWKIYKRAFDIEIGKLQKLKDFDLSSKTVQENMKKRYGDKIPYNEIVISPISIFDSDLLKTIREN